MTHTNGIALIFFAILVSSIGSAGVIAPVLYLPDDCLMGVAIGGKWLDGKTAAPQLGKSARAYQLYTQSGRTKTQTCSAPDPDPEGVDPGRAHDFTVRCGLKNPETPEADPFLIGIGGATTPLPRPVTFLTGNPAVYRKVVQDYLQRRIPNAPVTLDRVIRVDLEGDGKDEVLIAAHYFVRRKMDICSKEDCPLPLRGKPGWYSVVLLRKLDGSQVKTTAIAEDVYPITAKLEERVPTYYNIVGLFDVDGDGRFELLISSDYYEGGYTDLLQFGKRREGNLEGTVLASCGWGA